MKKRLYSFNPHNNSRFFVLLVLFVGLTVLLQACGDENTPVPATTQKYLTALQSEGWKVQAQDLKVVGQSQDLSFVQFRSGNRDILRVFDATSQPLNASDKVQAGLYDLVASLDGKTLKAEDRNQLEIFTNEFRQLDAKLAPLVKFNQYIQPLSNFKLKVKNTELPLGKLGRSFLLFAGKAKCALGAGVGQLICIIDIFIFLLEVVAKRAEIIEAQLKPTVAALNDYLQVSQNSSGSKMKEQVKFIGDSVANLDKAFDELKQEVEPLKEGAEYLSEFLAKSELIKREVPGIVEIPEKVLTPVTVYQEALDKQKSKSGTAKKILTDAQQLLDNKVNVYYQMWTQKP